MTIKFRLTRVAIEKEIRKQTGIDCRMFKGNGYFYFVSLSSTPTVLDFAPETSVYTNGLWTYTLQGWVDTFKALIEGVELPENSVMDSDGVIRL